MTFGYEWIIISWLYMFGAAAFATVVVNGRPSAIDFFVVVMWPVLWPLFTVIKAIYEIFE